MHFDEGSGSTFYDSSQYKNNGACSGANCPSYTTNAKSGPYALSFDGSNDYVDAGAGSSLNIMGEVTVSAWIKLNKLDVDQKIAGNQDNSAGGYKLGVYTNNKVEFEIRDSSNVPTLNRDVAGGTVLAADRWYHVVGTYSKSGHFIRTYVDGNLDRELSTTAVLAPTTGTLKFGRESSSSLYFWNGIIDEVSIWNTSLDASQINQFIADSSQVLLMHFEEGSGSTFYDSSQYKNNGVCSGANCPSYTTNSKFGKYALSFDGSNDFIDTSINPIGTSDPVTFGGWVRPTASGDGFFFSRGADGSGDGWSLFLNAKAGFTAAAAVVTTSGGATQFQANGNTVLTADTWYHIVGVWTPGVSVQVYVNGVLENTKTTTTTNLRTSTVNIRLGHINTALWYNGLIDEVAIWNTALSASQIKQLSAFCTGPISISWTDPVITPDVTKIRAVHLNELRSWIDNRRVDSGLSSYSWTDPTITAYSTKIRKVHFDEMRTAITQAYTQCGQSAPVWTDPTITPDVTKIRAVHVNELRSAVSTLCKKVDGGWSDWSACTGTGGSNIGTQSRTCTNPSPSCGGAQCSGSSSQSCDRGCSPTGTMCGQNSCGGPWGTNCGGSMGGCSYCCSGSYHYDHWQPCSGHSVCYYKCD